MLPVNRNKTAYTQTHEMPAYTLGYFKMLYIFLRDAHGSPPPFPAFSHKCILPIALILRTNPWARNSAKALGTWPVWSCVTPFQSKTILIVGSLLEL